MLSITQESEFTGRLESALGPDIILNIAERVIEIEPSTILSLLLTSKVCPLPWPAARTTLLPTLIG